MKQDGNDRSQQDSIGRFSTQGDRCLWLYFGALLSRVVGKAPRYPMRAWGRRPAPSANYTGLFTLFASPNTHKILIGCNHSQAQDKSPNVYAALNPIGNPSKSGSCDTPKVAGLLCMGSVHRVVSKGKHPQKGSLHPQPDSARKLKAGKGPPGGGARKRGFCSIWSLFSKLVPSGAFCKTVGNSFS